MSQNKIDTSLAEKSRYKPGDIGPGHNTPKKSPYKHELTGIEVFDDLMKDMERNQTSDGSTASYYELPVGAKELQDIIAYRDMNSQIGEIFRACMRYGKVEHSPKLRDAKKILFYAQEEVKRLERYGE